MSVLNSFDQLPSYLSTFLWYSFQVLGHYNRYTVWVTSLQSACTDVAADITFSTAAQVD